MSIIKYPNKRLRVICKEVKKINNKIKKDSQLLEHELNAIDTIFTPINALAANQIGLKQRIVVFKRFQKKTIMINPKIIHQSIPMLSLEICASIPHTIRIKLRKFIIKIQYTDLNNKTHQMKLVGPSAFTMQQEIDHLNGKLIIDKN